MPLNPDSFKPAAAPPPTLEVSDLIVIRGGVRILDGISWQMKAGEHWAILGANGSGKTSLLSALTGYLTPTSGAIDLLGQRYGAANWPELRKQVGIVSSSIRQKMADAEPALVSVVSGKYAMIDYWGKVRRQAREEALALLSQIGCEPLAERPWAVLSQGERQRVLIGRALMAHPQLLILDEPCAGLDPVAREHFLEFIERLSRTPGAPALVLVTHHVEEIVQGISHTLLLREGRVLAAGKRSVVLRESLLSKTFGEKIRVTRRDGRVTLRVIREANRRVF